MPPLLSNTASSTTGGFGRTLSTNNTVSNSRTSINNNNTNNTRRNCSSIDNENQVPRLSGGRASSNSSSNSSIRRTVVSRDDDDHHTMTTTTTNMYRHDENECCTNNERESLIKRRGPSSSAQTDDKNRRQYDQQLVENISSSNNNITTRDERSVSFHEESHNHSALNYDSTTTTTTKQPLPSQPVQSIASAAPAEIGSEKSNGYRQPTMQSPITKRISGNHHNNSDNSLSSSGLGTLFPRRRKQEPPNITMPNSTTSSSIVDDDNDDNTSPGRSQEYYNNKVMSRNSSSSLIMSKLTTIPIVGRCIVAIRNTIMTPVTGWRMLRLWFFGMIAPLGVVTWTITHQIPIVILSVIALPTIAIIQGSVAILKYRVMYGNSPLPMAPSHGIVKCITKVVTDTGKDRQSSSTSEQSDEVNNNNPLPSPPPDDIITKVGAINVNRTTTIGQSNSTPIRLLVIGDSLAVGVGQSKCSTPIMPETIAKSLSKALNGRPVLWTCHGAPGASAGWIVRELERSIRHGQFMQEQTYYPLSPVKQPAASTSIHSNQFDNLDSLPVLPGDRNGRGRSNSTQKGQDVDRNDQGSNDGDSSASSSSRSFDLSSSSSSSSLNENANLHNHQDNNTIHDDETLPWSDRLKDHKIRFDPNVLGPFDIAVVLTGSNDLKSAFFPFLLTGEDAEFRRQAQQRGGGYGSELTRLLQVLNSRMRMKLQTFRHQVEVAKDRVLESVDNIRDRLHSYDMSSSHQPVDPSYSDIPRALSEADIETDVDNATDGRSKSNNNTSSFQKNNANSATPHFHNGLDDNTNHTLSSHGALNSSLFPMVVLPGLPARALPIFTLPPLRWLAVPIVDIMDSHKDELSKQHNGEVLFVDAPPADEIAEFACQRGKYWDEAQQDHLLLKLRDIKKRRSQRIESHMEDYFSKMDPPKRPDELPRGRKHFAVWSEDGIHPNDTGYDFWGRYIAHSIVQEWKRKQDEEGIDLF